jgi:hypothetical protein
MTHLAFFKQTAPSATRPMPQITISGQQCSLEKPPRMERALHMICCDSVIREAHQTESIYRALIYNNFSRLAAAKTLTADSKCLQHVPVIARERFLEVLAATPVTAGMDVWFL